MQNTASLRRGGPYIVTEEGRVAAEVAEDCLCRPRLMGLLLECGECGTIFGSIRDDGKTGWPQGYDPIRREWKRA